MTNKDRKRIRANDARFRKKNRVRLRDKGRKRYWNNREKELARNKAYYPGYYQNNLEAIKAKRRNGRHGVTQEWFDAKMAEQNSCCAICDKSFEQTPHVDHDHLCCPPMKSCDKCRRDLLCKDCNLGLGRFKDDPVVLQKAIQYLAKHRGVQ